MSETSINAYKLLGETPLECLTRVRIEHAIGPDIPMTYAGRLDPMAEGAMIILVGDECKKKGDYLGLDKTYEFEILVGFETDTYDLLGVVKFSNEIASPTSASGRSSDLLARLSGKLGQTVPEAPVGFASVLKSFVGTFIQKYPPFSSKTVGGKQLFQLSKDDILPDEMPEHEVTISRLEYISTRSITKEELQKEIIRRIRLVHGDFRQEEILALWDENFRNATQKEYQIISCVLDCSSGTYVRQLVADLSAKLGIPLVTYSIRRIHIGTLL